MALVDSTAGGTLRGIVGGGLRTGMLRRDKDTFHYGSGRLEQLLHSLAEVDARRKQPSSQVLAIPEPEPEPEPSPERYAQELAQVRPQPDLGYDGVVRTQKAQKVSAGEASTRTTSPKRKRSWRKRAKTTRGEAWQ